MSLAFFISVFNAQHVSDFNTSILRSLRLICWVISWVVLIRCDACWSYVVVWLGVVWYPDAGWSTASLFNAQHVSDVNISILKSLRLICWVISWVVLIWYDACSCYVVVWLGWCGILMQIEALVLQPVAAVLVLNNPDDGRLRPKHVEWLCRNKTCTVLHQVGVSFDLYYVARKHKIKILHTHVFTAM